MIGDEEKDNDLSKIEDYSTYARKYLLSLGMEEENITKLMNHLSTL